MIRAHKSCDLRDLDRGHKDTPGDTFWMTWIYFLGDIDPFRVTFKFFAANTYTIRCVVHKIGLSLNF